MAQYAGYACSASDFRIKDGAAHRVHGTRPKDSKAREWISSTLGQAGLQD